MVNRQPIFYLLGFQRSGTTILCHLLDKHPEVTCVNEPELSKRIVYNQLEELANTENDSIKRSLDFFSVDPEHYQSLVDNYLNKTFSTGEFLSKAYGLFAPSGTETAGAKEVIDLSGEKYNWLEKLIQFHKNGNAKYIFIERDIKSVVSSFVKLGFFPPGKRRVNNWNLRRFAKQYMECIEKAYKSLPKDKSLFLQFEDITRNPKLNMKNLFSFLNVDSSDNAVSEILNTPSRGSQAEYKGQFDASKNNYDYLSEKQCLWLNKLYSIAK